MTEQFLKDMYNKYLKRNPEPEGFAYWKDKLDSGVLTEAQVEDYIAKSPEAMALHS